MATPIPALVSQFVPTDDTFIRDEDGSTVGFIADLFGNTWFYYVSNRTTVANGMSLLKAIASSLFASAGKTWTVRLSATSPFKLTLAHNGGGTTQVSMSADLAAVTGWGSGTSVQTATTVSAVTASPLFWTPDMPVSMTGPVQFDPAINYGVPTSAGSMQRAPDMTPAAVSNGVQYAAEYRFNGVTPYYKVRAPSTAAAVHINEDIETFWTQSLSKGRRVLYWRDRANLAGSDAPSEGTASPYNYVEYAPQPDLRENMPGTPMTPYVLTHWDVNLKLWVTENGETPLSD